jgi:hypothetical protein
LWLATGRSGRPPLILSAIVFGIAVSGMHYTAMAGLTVLPYPGAANAAPALSTDLLAIVVAIVGFCVSGIFLLILVPDRSRPAEQATVSSVVQDSDDPVHRHPEVAAQRPSKGDGSGAGATSFEARLRRAPQDDGQQDANPEFGRGGFSPLGGAGAPPRRFARHLPIERDGGTHFLAVEDVVAVHANAHYTTIFNGSDKLFCPLAIGDVEARLDGSRFVRIHRSHIVNIERVVGYKRSGDNELVEMDAPHDYAVPVSRSRVSLLKSRVSALSGADPPRRRYHFASQ